MRFFVAAMLSLCISDSAVSQISIRPNALSQTICDKQTGEPVVLIRRDSIGKSVTRFLIEHEFKHVSDALSHKGGCLGWESERDVSPAFSWCETHAQRILSRILPRRRKTACVESTGCDASKTRCFVSCLQFNAPRPVSRVGGAFLLKVDNFLSLIR